MKKINLITLLLLSALLIGCNDDGSSSGARPIDPIGDPDVVDTDGDGIYDVNDVDDDNNGFIEITTLEHLHSIRDDLNGNGLDDENLANVTTLGDTGCPADGCTGYELVNDLDFTDSASYANGSVNAAWTTGAGWPGIGFCTALFSCIRFSGDFHGNNFTITNLFINASSATHGVGLFAEANGTISNLRVINANVSGGATGIGILLGYGRNADIHNISSTGMVESAGSSVGGLIGNGAFANVTYSYASGSVNGASLVGGLIGFGQDASVGNSYATGSVSGDGTIGGLIGYGNSATVGNSYATGSVSGSQFVGGLIGQGFGATVDNSYAAGSVSGNSSVGGLIGFGTGTRVSSSYWDTNTTGQDNSAGGEGKTTNELQSPTNSTGIYVDWTDTCWDFGNTTQYPVLTCTPGGIAEQR